MVRRLRVNAPLCDAAADAAATAAAAAAAEMDNGNGMAFARSEYDLEFEKFFRVLRLEWLGSPFTISIYHNTCNPPYYPHPSSQPASQLIRRPKYLFPERRIENHTRIIEPTTQVLGTHADNTPQTWLKHKIIILNCL